MSCLVQNPETNDVIQKRQTKYRSITNDTLINDVVNFISIARSSNLRVDLGDFENVETNVDSITKLITKGQYNTLQDLYDKGTQEIKAFVWDSIKSFAENVSRSVVDYDGLQKKSARFADFMSLVRHARQLQSLGALPERIYYKALKTFGVVPEENIGIDFFGVRMNKLEHYDPTRKAFYLLNKIKDYSNSAWRNITNTVGVQLKNAFNGSASAQFMSLANMNRLLAYMDSDRQRHILNSIGSADVKEGFKYFANTLLKLKLSDDNLEIAYNDALNMQSIFNKINYGESNNIVKNPETIYENAGEGTILGYIKNVRNLISEFKSFTDEEGIVLSKEQRDMIERINAGLNSFKIRQNYIPFLDKHDEWLKPIRESSSTNITLASWLKHRKYDQDVDYASGDVIDSLNSNMGATSLMAVNLANMMYATYVEAAIRRDSAWFADDGTRRIIKTAALQSAEIARQEAMRYNTSDAIKKYKDGLTVFSSMHAIILAMPASAVNNYLSGFMNLTMRLAGEHKMYSYEQAMANTTEGALDGKIARACTEYSKKFLVNPGMVSEYIDVDGQFQSKASVYDKTVSTLMKATDTLTDGLGLGKAFNIYKYLTVKGSEEVLRSYATKLLYNRVYSEAIVTGSNNTDNIKALIEKHSTQVFYDINNALGNFNPINKPYMFHAFFDSSKNFVSASLGWILRFSYMFRHPGFVTAQNFLHSVSNLFDTQNPYNASVKGTIPAQFAHAMKDKGAALMAIGIGLAIMINDLMETEKKPTIRLSAFKALNPTEELPMEFLYVGLKGMLKGSMSDDEAQIFHEQGMKYVTGFLSGSRYISESGEVSSSPFNKLIFNMFDIDRLHQQLLEPLSTTIYGRGWDAYNALLSKEQKVKAFMGNDISNDLIKVVTDFTLGTFTNTEDSGEAWAYRSKLFSRHLSSAFGLTAYGVNIPDRVKSYGSDTFTDNYISALHGSKKYYGLLNMREYSDTASNMISYIQKYHRSPNPTTLIGD